MQGMAVMGIRLADRKSFYNAVYSEFQRMDGLVIRALSMLGEQCVRYARERSAQDSWIDRTGNLRSSIGYVIVKGRRIVSMSSFDTVKGGGEGSSTGKKLAEDLGAMFPNDYALVVVAGMNYAEYVEAMDNKDVLASPELFVRKKLPGMLVKLKNQIMR